MQVLPVLHSRQQVRQARLGMVQNNEVTRMTRQEYNNLFWWDQEKLYTDKDRDAFAIAKRQGWPDIDPGTAETDAGRYHLEDMIITKYHNEEHRCGIL